MILVILASAILLFILAVMDGDVDYVCDAYIEAGKWKLSIRFKGRQMAHTDLGHDVMMRFADALKDCSTIESQPKLEGRTMIMFLAPKKEI